MTARSTWKCPGCGHTVDVLAVEVQHRCPGRRTRWTEFAREPKVEESR